MNKFKVTFFIIVFLLLAAMIVFIVTSTNSEREYYYNSATVTTDNLSSPDVPSATPEIATPSPTLTPSPTPSPTPTPSPSPTPTPEPSSEPLGTVIAQGRFQSQSGSLIDIDADYSAVTATDTTVHVNVSVSLNHYAINCIGGRTLNISLGDDYQTVYVEPLNYDGGTRTTSLLGSYSFNVDLLPGQSVTLPLQVSWQFGGVYGGVELPSIDCGGQITLSR